jgi:NADH-quinone oxidoreductase subunit C
MPEEKPPETPQSKEETSPKPEKPAAAGSGPASGGTPVAGPAGVTPTPATTPAAKAHAEKAAAAPTGPVGEPWSGAVVEALRKNFPELEIQAFTYLGQNYLIVPREAIVAVSLFLRTEQQFTLLSDLTAADYPKREKRFEVVYQLYSFAQNERLRVKVPVGEQESIESVTPVWSGADWMEREVLDMFGIKFENHPNPKRILLPEEWEGYPLRKDYSIIQQDNRWVQENLHIQSGQ